MSIYSGFATRNQQKYYDKVLYNVISTLMVRIIKFYKSQTIDQKAFKKILKDQHKVVTKLQKHKYQQPKFAQLIQHFMRVLSKSEEEKHDQHVQFQMRRNSIEEMNGLNRTLSVLGNELHNLKQYEEKIDTLEMLDDINSDKDLQRIPERRPKQHSKKKSKKPRANSMKSGIDLWDVRRQRLPQIPSLQPIEQSILGRTRFNNFSDKLTNKTIDDNVFDRDLPVKKGLENPPKFRAKVFFK